MNQRRFTSSDFVPQGETGEADAVLDPNDPIHDILTLAGIPANKPQWQEYKGLQGSNISGTGNEKADLMRTNNIKPGSPEWFKLWFSKPYLTGEKPI
jgi:hypothetical protein